MYRDLDISFFLFGFNIPAEFDENKLMLGVHHGKMWSDLVEPYFGRQHADVNNQLRLAFSLNVDW